MYQNSKEELQDRIKVLTNDMSYLHTKLNNLIIHLTKLLEQQKLRNKR